MVKTVLQKMRSIIPPYYIFLVSSGCSKIHFVIFNECIAIPVSASM